jgi:hypothetical protein
LLAKTDLHLSGRAHAREGCDDRRRDRDDRRDGWEIHYDRQLRDDEEYPDANRDNRLLQARPLRLDFPRFDGDNPAGWTYKVNQFFNYNQMPLC